MLEDCQCGTLEIATAVLFKNGLSGPALQHTIGQYRCTAYSPGKRL